ncbi:MAG: hypothetical protein MUF72_06735 [Elainella sp. Prado103]|jgi:hypothetical protein|nr:hypothetical protein [Elainella sp. Prado103]
MSRSPVRSSDESTRKNRPLVYALNRLVIVAANAAVLGLLISAIVEAFAVGLEAGLRSLAAAALPPIVLTYSSFFAGRSPRTADRVLEVNLFAIGLVWILVLLVLVNFVSTQFSHTIPLGEFVISLTLSVLTLLNNRLSTRSLLSCSYGILSGFLLHLLIFGLPNR